MSGRVKGEVGQYNPMGSIINEIPAEHVYIFRGFIDMRMSIDGLAAVVKQAFKHDMNERNLYLFCGKRSDRFKALYYDGDGYILLYKRLQSGRYQWPRRGADAKLLTARQLRWLLEGLCIEQPKALASAAPKFII